MRERDKKYTAFSTSQGYFEYNQMPLGLIGKKCFAYIGDIVIFGDTMQQHNKNMEDVLQRIKQLGLRLEPSKCEYLKHELEYLGHIITEEGVKSNPEKLGAIKNFKELKTVNDVHSFLGLSGFYRKFIKKISSIARPLIKLTQKNTIFDWTSNCEKAFYDLKNALISAPVLRFPNFK